MNLTDILHRAYEQLQQGHIGEAEQLYQNALDAFPASEEAWHLLGFLYLQQNHYQDGVECLQKSCALAPDNPFIHNNLANGLLALNQPDAAAHHYTRALQLKADFPQAFQNRGKIFHQRGHYEQALADYDAGLQIDPTLIGIWIDRGLTLHMMQRYDEACNSFNHAIKVDPSFPAAFYGRGMALKELRRFGEAADAFEQVLRLAPDTHGARLNLGNALKEIGQLDQAIAHYGLLIAQNPEDHQAVFNQALTLLLQGDWKRGLPLYEARRFLPQMGGARSYSQPLWLGQSVLAEKTLFVYAEQGLGDTLQFCRYLQLLPTDAKIIFAVPRKLWHFVDGLHPDMQIIDHDATPEFFNYHIPLLSLPLAMGTTVADIPAPTPYLYADPARIELWKKRIGDHGFKVGVCWRGANTPELQGRSFPLALLAPLAKRASVRLISLQKGDGLEELGTLPAGMQVEAWTERQDNGPDAFADTAAIMMHMDLIVTLDSASAHLAGALGRPVWVALKYIPDWRWLMQSTRSPWYPSARLFRQKQDGDWQSVFSDIEQELRMILSSQTTQQTPYIPVGWGELFDKITILEIKQARITAAGSLANIGTELAALRKVADPVLAATPTLPALIQNLATINQKLWDIEDALRDKEKAKLFDAEFISLARSVYITNDQRAAVKRQINQLLSSTIIEEKSYHNYEGND